VPGRRVAVPGDQRGEDGLDRLRALGALHAQRVLAEPGEEPSPRVGDALLEAGLTPVRRALLDAVGATGAPKPAAAAPGKAQFASTCGGCHTLKDAGTSGSVGPNLDQLKPSEALVKSAIAKGGAGSGQMPPGLLSGADADQVAAYVANAAGG